MAAEGQLVGIQAERDQLAQANAALQGQLQAAKYVRGVHACKCVNACGMMMAPLPCAQGDDDETT